MSAKFFIGPGPPNSSLSPSTTSRAIYQIIVKWKSTPPTSLPDASAADDDDAAAADDDEATVDDASAPEHLILVHNHPT